MPYRYDLVPMVWQTAGSHRPHWRLPASAVGGVDLRSLPHQAAAGGAPQGFAFAALRQSSGGVQLATSFHLNQAATTGTMRDAWQSATGYRPAGATVTDLLMDQLTNGSDPTGQSGPKPLLPDAEGFLRLFIGGHSLVKEERFVWGVHPHTNRIRDLLRLDFTELFEAVHRERRSQGSAEPRVHRRLLDYWRSKYRCDWREFVPLSLREHVEGPLPYETLISDNFDVANSATLTGQLTWTEKAGGWLTTSNHAEADTGGADNFARADSDLSSDDHYAQVAVTQVGTTGSFRIPGVTCRNISTAALTSYNCDLRFESDVIRLHKYVAGVQTVLGTPVSVTIAESTPYTVKISSDGSTIKSYLDGTEKESVTDSSITGNVRCGLWGFYDNAADVLQYDNFQAEDLSTGHNIAVGLVSSTETSQPMTRRKTKAIGLDASQETAFSFTRRKTFTTGISASLETSLAAARSKTKAIGLSASVETAQDMGQSKSKAIGLAASLETSFTVTVEGATVVAVGLASSLETSQTLDHDKAKGIGLAASVETAFPQTVKLNRYVQVNLASSLETSQTMTVPKIRLIGQAQSLESALTVTASGGLVLVPPLVEFTLDYGFTCGFVVDYSYTIGFEVDYL